MTSDTSTEESKVGRQRPSSGEELGRRISQVVALYQTKRKAAEVAEISVDQLSAYEKAKNKAPFEVLTRLARAKGVRLEWLASGEGPMLREEGAEKGLAGTTSVYVPAEELPEGFVLVPRFDVEASAGPGAFADREQVVDYLAFKGEWVRRTLGVDPRRLVLISAIGDSNEPTIRSGDLLLIDTSVTHIEDNAFYVLALADAIVVKRVQRFLSGAVTIKSDNPAYVDETLASEELDAINVAGRVRWIGRLV